MSFLSINDIISNFFVLEFLLFIYFPTTGMLLFIFYKWKRRQNESSLSWPRPSLSFSFLFLYRLCSPSSILALQLLSRINTHIVSRSLYNTTCTHIFYVTTLRQDLERTYRGRCSCNSNHNVSCFVWIVVIFCIPTFGWMFIHFGSNLCDDI